MKFSVEWLQDLSGSKETPEKLAGILSQHAFETEVTGGQEFNNIIVAKVLKVEKHPNADRLRVVELTDGRKTIAPVVCGAWNFEAGAIVPLALPGAIIPHDQHDPEQKPFTLTKATIRGVESQGMICSGKELGISDDGNGILLLSENSTIGSTFGTRTEAIFDISAPANRPDLAGYRGVAREITALTGTRLNLSTPKLPKAKTGALKVSITSKNLCRKYLAVRLKQIKIGASPDFIQRRLKASGLRPINNIVDITNYVMLETGQPLHAFDAQKVAGTITVRTAKPGEHLITLDGIERELPVDSLVIADSEKPLAIAGVIGGLESGVTQNTTSIILESANFYNVSIRKTARAIGLRTDASWRFEKSLPLALTDEALALAVSLFSQYAEAVVSEIAAAGQLKLKPVKVPLLARDVSNLLGFNVPAPEQKKILMRYGFKVTGAEKMTVTVPDWRPDVSIWQDLAEEIGRYIGINNIKPAPVNVLPSSHLADPFVVQRQETADILSRLDFSEIYTYSFVSAQDLKIWGVDPLSAVEVANPLSFDQQYMRTNLLVNDYKTAEFNGRFQDAGKYFDIGNVYWMENENIVEEAYLCLSAFARKGSQVKAHEVVAGAFLAMCEGLGITAELSQEDPESAKIEIGGKKIGYIMLRNSDDLSWSAVHVKFAGLWAEVKSRTYLPPSKYPAKELDISVLADSSLTWAEIERQVINLKIPLLRKIKLFDVYEGFKLPANKRSLSFRLTYQSEDRTLTDKEVNPVHEKLIQELTTKLNLTIRE